MYLSFRISSSFLLAALLTAVSASTLANSPDLVSTNLQTFGIDVALNDVRVGNGNGPAMAVPNYKIGQVVNYNGAVDVNFYLSPESITTTPDEDAVLIGSVALNPQWRETLLVWTPISGNQFSILALPNDLQTLAINHLRFVNTTQRRIGLKIRADESIILNPGEHYTLNSNETEAVYFWSAMEVNGVAAERISNVVEMRSHLRRTVFLTYSNSAATGNDPLGPRRFGFFVFTHN